MDPQRIAKSAMWENDPALMWQYPIRPTRQNFG
jgi:hypothetical protein